MKNKNYYVEYNDVDLSNLANWERDVIVLFKQATKICGEIYLKQKNPDCPGGNFYPCDATKEEIEKAAKVNPEIVSPYSIVVRSQDGSLQSMSYQDIYKKEISNLSKLLIKAAPVYEMNGYSLYASYLKQLANDLKTSNYQESERIWLKIDWKINVDIKLGPIETYQDRLLGVKRAFQANLRIRDDVDGQNIGDYIDVTNALIPSSPFYIERNAKEHGRLIVRIDKVIAMSGWHADFIPRASDYPSDIKFIGFGTKILVYTNNIRLKQKVVAKIINSLIILDDEDKLKDTLDLSAVRIVTLHEIAETVSKFGHIEGYSHLGEMHDAFVELNADILGLKVASVQVLKGVFDINDYKSLIIEYLGVVLRGCVYGKSGTYAIGAFEDGYRLVLNYFIKDGAIKLTPDLKVRIDFTAIYSSIDILSRTLDKCLTGHDKKSVEKLFKDFSSEDHLNKFKDILSNIVFEGN